MPHRIACAIATAMLAACGGNAPTTVPTATLAPAEMRVGETTLRATTLPSMRLDEAMAARYGIARDPANVALVVGMRRGAPMIEVSLRGRVTAQATDLLGRRHAIALREVRDGEFVDYVGTVRIAPPDTLDFRVEATPEGGARMALRFNRDVFPED